MAAAGGSRSVFIGNLPYRATENDIGDFFAQVGRVVNVRIVSDKYTQQPKGFGFCEFESPDMAAAAVNQMNGQEFMGRTIRVDYANDRN